MLAVFFVGFCSAAPFGDNLPKCDLDNPAALSNCIASIVDNMRGDLIKGIPELAVPSLDPMSLDSLPLNIDDVIDINFKKLKLRGLGNFTTQSLKVDPVAKTLSMELRVPQIRITGQHSLRVAMPNIAINGEGTFWNVLGQCLLFWLPFCFPLPLIHLSAPPANIVVKANSNLVTQMRNGKEIIQVADQQLSLDAEKMRLQFSFSDPNKKAQADLVNSLVQANNGIDTFVLVRPQMEEIVKKMVVTIMNTALASMPTEKFLKSG